MARPKKYEKERVATAVRLPEELHDRLTREASEREVSANLIITRAIEEYLDRLVPLEEALTTRTA